MGRNLKLLAGGRAAAADPAPVREDLTELALAARGGDEIAVTRLWESAHDFLTRIAVAFGVQLEEVPDLVQETMWAAHQALDRFSPERGRFEAWSGTILVRFARNRLRSLRRRTRMLERFAEALNWRPRPRGPGEDNQSLEARLTLERLLAVLTDRQRDVIALYEIAGLDSQEVGTILGMTEGSVRSIARTAREKLTRAAHRMDRRQRRGR